MTKAEQFEALSLRCEQATGPDRELDAAIYIVVVRGENPADFRINPQFAAYIPKYTASLDAARSISDAMLIHASDIGADGLPMVGLVADTSTSPPIEHTGIARTLELAWCAAALRARAQMERGK